MRYPPAVNPLAKHLPVVAILGGFLAIALLLPLGKALEIEGDEGFELNKAFLQSHGCKLYTEIWDDQPPLYTSTLAAIFRVLGPSILGARSLTLGFSLLLLISLYGCVSHKFDPWAGCVAVALLVAAPRYLFLSVSVMKEIPALSLALAAAWALFQWEKRRSWPWLIFSGALFGLGLMIKFSAALVLPALLLEMLIGTRRAGGRLRLFLGCAGTWVAGTLCTAAVLGATLGFGGLSLLLGTHLSVQEIPGIPKPGDFPFPTTFFAIHADGYACCVASLWLVYSRRLWTAAAFPLVQLATTAVVHAWHRPWWNYYYLHLAVPAAWLASLFVRDAVQTAWSALVGRARIRPSTFAVGVLLAATVVQSIQRFAAAARVISSSTSVANDPMLKHIDLYRDRAKWMYAQPIIYPFHARLPMPPELAVVTLKRYWSGQITPAEILDVCREYKPEQLVLYQLRAGGEWTEFLKADYARVYEDTNCVLFVSKTILPEPGDGR
jgi:hypothetical protein